MKKWNNPEITALELNKTENGFFCANFELCVFTHDDTPKGSDDKGKEETPGDDVTNLAS